MMPDTESGLELRVDYRGKATLWFKGERIVGQVGFEIDFPRQEGGILHADFHMSAVKVVHLPKVVPEAET